MPKWQSYLGGADERRSCVVLAGHSPKRCTSLWQPRFPFGGNGDWEIPDLSQLKNSHVKSGQHRMGARSRMLAARFVVFREAYHWAGLQTTENNAWLEERRSWEHEKAACGPQGGPREKDVMLSPLPTKKPEAFGQNRPSGRLAAEGARVYGFPTISVLTVSRLRLSLCETRGSDAGARTLLTARLTPLSGNPVRALANREWGRVTVDIG